MSIPLSHDFKKTRTAHSALLKRSKATSEVHAKAAKEMEEANAAVAALEKQLAAAREAAQKAASAAGVSGASAIDLKAREAASHSALRTAAATEIQRHYRGRLGRKKAQGMRRERDAAVTIQRLYRGYVGRNIAKEALAERKAERDAKEKLHNASAVTIQKAYRGHLGRKKAAERLESLKGEMRDFLESELSTYRDPRDWQRWSRYNEYGGYPEALAKDTALFEARKERADTLLKTFMEKPTAEAGRRILTEAKAYAAAQLKEFQEGALRALSTALGGTITLDEDDDINMSDLPDNAKALLKKVYPWSDSLGLSNNLNLDKILKDVEAYKKKAAFKRESFKYLKAQGLYDPQPRDKGEMAEWATRRDSKTNSQHVAEFMAYQLVDENAPDNPDLQKKFNQIVGFIKAVAESNAADQDAWVKVYKTYAENLLTLGLSDGDTGSLVEQISLALGEKEIYGDLSFLNYTIKDGMVVEMTGLDIDSDDDD